MYFSYEEKCNRNTLADYNSFSMQSRIANAIYTRATALTPSPPPHYYIQSAYQAQHLHKQQRSQGRDTACRVRRATSGYIGDLL